MNGRESIIRELIENVEAILNVVEDQEVLEPEFSLIYEKADQLREEIAALES